MSGNAEYDVTCTQDHIGNRETHDLDGVQTTYAQTNELNQYEKIAYFAPGQEILAYDADGNMTHSGLVAADFSRDGRATR